MVAAAALLLANALPGGAQHRQDGASIVDSGSTNVRAFKVDLWSTGRTRIATAGAVRWAQIDSELTRKFFSDVKAARDVNAQGQPCMKSASFGTRRTVLWHRWTSPDLQCPLEGRGAALKADVDAVVKQLNISPPLGRVIHLPRNEPRAAPHPSPSI